MVVRNGRFHLMVLIVVVVDSAQAVRLASNEAFEVEKLLVRKDLEIRAEDFEGDVALCNVRENRHRQDCGGVCNRHISLLMSRNKTVCVGFIRHYQIGDILMVPRVVTRAVYNRDHFNYLLYSACAAAYRQQCQKVQVFVHPKQYDVHHMLLEKQWPLIAGGWPSAVVGEQRYYSVYEYDMQKFEAAVGQG